ncbi:retrovirus-related pol polyprotein from transposon RE1 [Citrus sinensis]|nr:retrovirus-related pol polyprotein from transposon RE1 [Citrus sinensis]
MAAFNSNQNTTSSFTFTSPVKLDRTNYTIWKSQVLTSVRANGLEDFLDNSKPCPEQFSSDGVINSDSDAAEINAAEGVRENPAFTVTDELAVAGSPVSSLDFLTHLISGLGQPYYPVVVYIEANLAKMSVNEAYSMLLTHEARLEANQLNSSKEAKMNFAANVAQTGQNTKSGQYNANWNKNQNGNGNGGRGGFGRGFSQGQVRGNWNGNWNNGWNGASPGNYQGRGGFGSGNGNFAKPGGFLNSNGRGSSDLNSAGVIYQICFKPKHTAAECRNRFNREFIPFNSSSGYNSYQYPVPRPAYANSAPRAAFVAASEGDFADQGWYIDSGATHHLTNNLQNLSLAKEYSGILQTLSSSHSSDTSSYNTPHQPSFSIRLPSVSTLAPQPAQNIHPMLTRSKAGVFKPKTYLAVTQHLEPHSVKAALADFKWKQAMQVEFDALQKNSTWILVPRETAGKIVGNKWVFKVKYNPDGSISKYKARLVAKGFHPTQGVDFFETFSPVVKPCTIRIILSLAVMNHWPIRQLDINNAFLNGILTEEVFMHQPEGFIHPQFPSHVCKLTKALYGLKQAPRAWYDRLKLSLLNWGFIASKSDTLLFIFHKAGDIVVILVYVDDILVIGSNVQLVEKVIHHLSSEFALKDLGEFNYFLGLEVTPSVEADLGLQFYASGSLTLSAFSNADWGSDLDDRKSVGGYCIYLGNNLISWSSKKQPIVSRSTAESEYRALALAVSETLWITYLLQELKVTLLQTPVIYCDNKSAEALASNPKYHSRTKHIELDLHFIRDHIAQKELHISHVPSYDQVADIFTKPLAFDQFNYLRSKLNVLTRP